MAFALRALPSIMSAFGIDIASNQICIIPDGLSKREALELLIDAVATSENVTDRDAFYNAVFEREEVMSTGIGGGIAIPHVRIPEVTQPTIGVGVSPKGVDFGTLDNEPVHVLVLFATPKGAEKEYLGQLAQVMLALRDKALYDQLVVCKTCDEIYDLLNE